MIRTRISLFGSLALSVIALAICRPSSAQLTFTYTTFDLGDSSNSVALGLSNTGDIVGAGLLNNGYHGIVRHNGVDTALDYTADPAVIGTTLTNINSSGDITGLRFYSAGGNFEYSEDFLYHNGVFNTFDTPASLPPGSTYVYDINGVNDAGQVGIGYLDAQNVEHGAIYDIASNAFTLVPDVSNAGVVDGDVLFVASNGDYLQQYLPNNYNNDVDSTLVHDGIPTSIDFPGATATLAYIINASGLIAGTYYTDPNFTEVHGFVYDHGTYYSLDYPGAIGTNVVFGLNDADQIVGTYYDANYYEHSMFIQITPEPGSVGLLIGMALSGAGFLMRRRIRRLA